jgi:hypothetical protein
MITSKNLKTGNEAAQSMMCCSYAPSDPLVKRKNKKKRIARETIPQKKLIKIASFLLTSV